MNQWIAAAVAEKVGVVETAAGFFTQRAGKAAGAGSIKFLRHTPDVEPEPLDQKMVASFCGDLMDTAQKTGDH